MTAPPLLESGAAAILGRDLSDRERRQFSHYVKLLVEWQRVHRIVGSDDAGWIIEHLLLDSLLFIRVLPPARARIMDLGSGAGIPGIPLAIVLESHVTLVEARQKRASFLAHALRELRLVNAVLMRARLSAESIPRELAGTFDAVVARCAGDHSAVVPVALELVRPGGAVIVSGPPAAKLRGRPLILGSWVTVPGVIAGTQRQFAVVSRPVRAGSDAHQEA